jgi:transcriptional regulator with AAA-type ATPase domain
LRHELRGAEQETTLHLTVMGPSVFYTHPLPAQGTVAIGRDESADVRITDPDASRQHARLHIGEKIEVEDLGSTNGTRIREERISPGQPVAILPGEAITIGWTTLMVQRRRPAFKPRRVWPHGYFEGRLEEECERAAGHRATFAVVRLAIRWPRDTAAAGDLLAAGLRAGDVLAVYAANDYEVLLVDSAREVAAEIAAGLTRSLTDAGISARTSVVYFPADGLSAQALIERGSALLHGQEPERPAQETVTEAPAIRNVYALAARAAAGQINVLILGETGTGKEVLATAIHRMSRRAQGPFVCINCAAISPGLLESELFGHEKGAFTGAVQAKEGLLEGAHGGTVFLDEVGEMPLGLQAKLLRVVETREVIPVGGVKARPIDVRFLAATNRDLEEEVSKKTFRQDLYFRLNGISLTVPPLRERPGDIEPLARSFVASAVKVLDRPAPALSEEALRLLGSYCWPGNVRELRNVMERAVLLCDGSEIGAEHLPVEKMQLGAPGSGAPARGARPRAGPRGPRRSQGGRRAPEAGGRPGPVRLATRPAPPACWGSPGAPSANA